MTLPLPAALANFAKTAAADAASLDGILKSTTGIQDQVKTNTAAAMKDSIVAAGGPFAAVPQAVEEASRTFLESAVSPAVPSQTVQDSSFLEVFNSQVPSGAAVDKYVASNVRIDDIIPAHQLFNIVKNLGATSLYSDPLQAYAQVNEATHDMTNMCKEAEKVATGIIEDVTNLLSVQTDAVTGGAYPKIASMNFEFFGSMGLKVNTMLVSLGVINKTLAENGKFNPSQTATFCSLLDDVSQGLVFADTKLLQYETLRRDIVEGLKRLRGIGRSFRKTVGDVKRYIPTYAASVVAGRLFQDVQKRILRQTGVDLQKILDTLELLSETTADDRTKILATFSIAATLQAIKSYVCNIRPANTINSPPAGPFTALKAAYDTFAANLNEGAVASAFDGLEQDVIPFQAAAQVGGFRDNSADLASFGATIIATLTALLAQLVGVCDLSSVFESAYKAQLAILGPDRAAGPNEIFTQFGLDNAREKAISENLEDFLDQNLNDATKLGEFADSLASHIGGMNDGAEKDRMIVLHDEIRGLHRAVVLNADFEQRRSVETFIAKADADDIKKRAADVVKKFSKLNEDEFDVILFE